CKSLCEVLLGLDGAQGGPQLCCLALDHVQMHLGVLECNAPTAKERHNPVALQGFLTESLLQSVLLLNDAIGLATTFAQLPADFGQRLFRIPDKCPTILPDEVFELRGLDDFGWTPAGWLRSVGRGLRATPVVEVVSV